MKLADRVKQICEEKVSLSCKSFEASAEVCKSGCKDTQVKKDDLCPFRFVGQETCKCYKEK